jgi:VCBS repeat-containing protein
VFGLGSNAKMVLNEMVYDPNGSSNSSLLSLVQGTISFVAGATAKHGDMKVDTPVATMGIRGTAVLVEIDFEVPGTGGAPPARFQVLIEPDGTSGSYVLLDKLTLLPIATVNQPGTQTSVNGQGVVSFLSSANLSQEAQDVINKVFALKFSDNSNPNSNTKFTDSLIPQNTFVQLANGEMINVRLLSINFGDNSGAPTTSTNPTQNPHIPGKPDVATVNKAFSEKTDVTASTQVDSVSGGVTYADVNAGDVPTVKIAFGLFTYQDAQHQDVTTTLTATQLAAIDAIKVPLAVVQDPAGKNFGTATWTYNIADHALDFLADGEQVTLTYVAQVDNNYAPNNETTFKEFTITITGTNDTPTIVVNQTTASDGVVEDVAVNAAGNIVADGIVTFNDVDLTDTHTVSFVLKSSDASADLPGFAEGVGPGAAHIGTFALAAVSEVPADANTNGSVAWTFTLDDDDPVLQSLAAGQTITQIYTITVSDGHGGTVTQDVTITITGSNDHAKSRASHRGRIDDSHRRGDRGHRSQFVERDRGRRHHRVQGHRSDRHAHRDFRADVFDLECAPAGLCRQHDVYRHLRAGPGQ